MERLTDRNQDGKPSVRNMPLLGLGVFIYRLKELVEADREGRCVVLPCNVGDTIYLIDGDGVREMTVNGITCGISGVWKVHAHTDKRCTLWKAYEIRLEAFDKNVFLTREAAEKALEEQHGNGN